MEIKNYYQIDKGYVNVVQGEEIHISYEIPDEPKFSSLREAVDEIVKRNVNGNEYLELKYYENGEYEFTVAVIYSNKKDYRVH